MDIYQIIKPEDVDKFDDLEDMEIDSDIANQLGCDSEVKVLNIGSSGGYVFSYGEESEVLSDIYYENSRKTSG